MLSRRRPQDNQKETMAGVQVIKAADDEKSHTSTFSRAHFNFKTKTNRNALSMKLRLATTHLGDMCFTNAVGRGRQAGRCGELGVI